MMIGTLSHVAVGVSDMDRSLRFYRDALGLTVSRDTIENFPEQGDIPAVRRRAVYLRGLNGDDRSFIVLDQQERADQPPPRRFYELGIHHYGFWVEDVDGIVARARGLGADIMMAPLDSDSADYGEPAGKAIRSALLRDPDGNIVQLDQR